MDIESYIDASRGQDVYIDPNELSVSSRTGIETGTLIASNVTMRDQTSDALNNGETGLVILDIRPAGTSVLPDVLLDTISNDGFKILDDPSDSGDKTVNCRDIIAEMDNRTRYNARSLAQYLVCQYVFWQRLEQRIDIKQCLLDGRSDCK